jgi:hypothetical protein
MSDLETMMVPETLFQFGIATACSLLHDACLQTAFRFRGSLTCPPVHRAVLTRRRGFISKCERVLMIAPIFFEEIGSGRLA